MNPTHRKELEKKLKYIHYVNCRCLESKEGDILCKPLREKTLKLIDTHTRFVVGDDVADLEKHPRFKKEMPEELYKIESQARQAINKEKQLQRKRGGIK